MLHNYILHLIMAKEGNLGANRRPPGRTGQRTEVRGGFFVAGKVGRAERGEGETKTTTGVAGAAKYRGNL